MPPAAAAATVLSSNAVFLAPASPRQDPAVALRGPGQQAAEHLPLRRPADQHHTHIFTRARVGQCSTTRSTNMERRRDRAAVG